MKTETTMAAIKYFSSILEIDLLEKMKSDAIRSQDWEEAATLRDKIRKAIIIPPTIEQINDLISLLAYKRAEASKPTGIRFNIEDFTDQRGK